MADLKTKMIAAVLNWWLNMIRIICRFYMSISGIMLYRQHISNKPYSVDCGDELAIVLRDVKEGLENDIQAASTSICAMVKKLGPEVDMVARKEKLFGELIKVPGLTNEEIVRAHLVIGRDNSLLVQFPTVPDEMKAAWIQAVL